jgi:transmembrane protein
MRVLGGLTMAAPSVGVGPRTPDVVAKVLTHPTTLLFARLCLAAPFLWAGVYKLLNWPGGVAEMTGAGLQPAWMFNLAALVTELGGSVLVILNRAVWIGAGALGVFTVLATFLAHGFWDLSGSARIVQINSFLEHAAISASFIFVTAVAVGQNPRIGCGRMSNDSRLS